MGQIDGSRQRYVKMVLRRCQINEEYYDDELDSFNGSGSSSGEESSASGGATPLTP